MAEPDFLVQAILTLETNNQDGQSTVEFILTFAFGVSLILAIFSTAMNFATGYLVHYATFMASRVYLTSDSHIGGIGSSGASLNGAEAKAKDVFNGYKLTFFNVPNDNFVINPAGATDPSSYLTVGGYTTFELRIDVLGNLTGQKKLEMVSESFLGKEVTRAECATRMCYAITGSTCDETMDITLYDDGC
jgi:hypothetical protein